MAKNKRRRDEAATEQGDVEQTHDVAPKRRKRTEADFDLVQIYNDLADEVQAVRIKAASDLLKAITSDLEHRSEQMANAERRLIRGLCSGRKAARLGFSIALAEVFRFKFVTRTSKSSEEIQLRSTVSLIVELTEPEGNAGGQERRDHLLGRRFAYQALLQSDVGTQKNLPDAQWAAFTRAIFELANHKVWLRRELGGMLYDYLISTGGTKLEADRVKLLVEAANKSRFLTTPEGVGLWLTIEDFFPIVKLPEQVWHHNDPLSKGGMTNLNKVLLDSANDDAMPTNKSGSRQATPGFAWTAILSRLYRNNDEREFAHFWETCVSSMFSRHTSPERKALGLQIFSLAISTAPASVFRHVLGGPILRCVLDQRAKIDNNLYEASKVPLNGMVSRAMQQPEIAGALVCAVVQNSVPNFDQQTKTRTLESIVTYADDASLEEMIETVDSMIRKNSARTEVKLDAQTRGLVDLILVMVRTHKDAGASLTIEKPSKHSKDHTWLGRVLESLVRWAYSAEQSSDTFRPRLMSALNILMTGPLHQAVKAPVFVVMKARSRSDAWMRHKKRASKAVDKAYDCMATMFSEAPSPVDTLIKGNEAFALLFSLSILQVFNDEADALAALEDLITCYESRNIGSDSTTMVIELLLSFISKPSALFRKLAEQVFTAFAPELTEDSLQSFFDILQQKETLSGQQELFDAHDGDGDGVEAEAEAEDDSEDDEVEEIDMEEASDVEFASGELALANGSEEDDDSDDSSESSSDAEAGAANGQDDEEAAFDKKLAEALGTGRLDDDDSDEDGSDMDDDQMMALEPHLTSIFKQRQKTTSKKQEKKDAKENIINFKNRVLDLLSIFVKSQYASTLALELIIPLTELVRTTTNKQTAEKAFSVLKQYFEACNKHKQLPQVEDSKTVFDLLVALHAGMKSGGSKLHANACSRSSLFLAKVLVAMDPKHYDEIAGMYKDMMSEWWRDQKSNVQPSIFTEWTSWSIATRKSIA